MTKLEDVKYIPQPPINGYIYDVGILNPYWVEKNQPQLASTYGIESFTQKYGEKYLPTQQTINNLESAERLRSENENTKEEKPKLKSESPQKPGVNVQPGLVVSDPQSGTLFIGEDAKTPRVRQVELHSSAGGHLKLFKDGGFEIHGNPCDVADNIRSNAADGLNIQSSGKNLRIDAGSGILTLAAREIRFESSAADEAFVFRSAQNIIIEAADSIRLNAANIAIGARNKLVLGSKGPIYMRGTGGVTIIEPKSALIPTNLGEFVDKIIETLVFGGL